MGYVALAHSAAVTCTGRYAHSRSCPSGDNSLEAAKLAVKEVVAEEGDDYFVFLLSDANLGRCVLSRPPAVL